MDPGMLKKNDDIRSDFGVFDDETMDDDTMDIIFVDYIYI